MKRVLIVQARMTSTRLPGKVLMDLAGAPMLTQQLRRLKRCKSVDEIVVAATENAADEAIRALAAAEGVSCFRGSENDVLSRYAGAARQAQADLIVRVTSDCPLIDPEQTDRVVRELEDSKGACDYASNVIERTFPRGLDAEAMTRQALERMDREAKSPPAREHVTYYLLKEHPELFKTRIVVDIEDNSDLRWTVDTPEDLELARRLYAALDLGRKFLPYRDILAYVRKTPELVAINAEVRQKDV
ncbi:MAG: glycosyltransferase family protein [Elusimicrobia bacterium]|nr:glycosyltransferase family protein [Elusimicrobiota bacterium]